MRSKYGNRKTVVNGIEFDSRKEAVRYQELRLLERAGKISGLRLQEKFVLIPSQREASTEVYKSGSQKGRRKPGKLLEKECSYIHSGFLLHRERRDRCGGHQRLSHGGVQDQAEADAGTLRNQNQRNLIERRRAR